jgi:hypothetical protein
MKAAIARVLALGARKLKQSADIHAAPNAASPFTLQQTLIIKEKWNDRNNLACRVDLAAARRFPVMAAQP